MSESKDNADMSDIVIQVYLTDKSVPNDFQESQRKQGLLKMIASGSSVTRAAKHYNLSTSRARQIMRLTGWRDLKRAFVRESITEEEFFRLSKRYLTKHEVANYNTMYRLNIR